MFFIWLLLVLAMTGSVGLKGGGRRIPMPPRPKTKQSKNKNYKLKSNTNGKANSKHTDTNN